MLMRRIALACRYSIESSAAFAHSYSSVLLFTPLYSSVLLFCLTFNTVPSLVCFGCVLSVLWQEANRIAVKMMREAGVAILDLHALTHGREDRSHDGTHYWNQVATLLFLCP